MHLRSMTKPNVAQTFGESDFSALASYIIQTIVLAVGQLFGKAR